MEFLEYNFYTPTSFIKIRRLGESHKESVVIALSSGYPSVFDDENEYEFFVYLYMKMNVFALVLSAIA